MLLDEIKKANVTALKEKNSNARTIYSILINKSMQEIIKKRTTNEELTDADVVNIIQKTIKELTEEAENYKKVNHTAEVDKINEQKEIIEKYLPKMLSAEEIKTIILSLEDKSIPFVMKHFKANYNGKCDMKTVQDVLKQL